MNYELKEISRHKTPTDCWLVILGKVYDVSDFVSKHPGGHFILTHAGKDSTILFEAYHSKDIKCILKKFYIGNVANPQKSFEFEDEFYEKIKRRVNTYFREHNLHPKVAMFMYIKTISIMITLSMSYYFAFFGTLKFWIAFLCAASLGFSRAQVGLNIQHDANHGAFHKNWRVNYYVGLSLDFMGVSSFHWKVQHFGHHEHTNIDGLDPDIPCADPDIRRVTSFREWRAFHAWQHVYLAILYCLLGIKSLVNDFIIKYSRKNGSIEVPQMLWYESITFWTIKLIWIFYYLIVPMMYSHFSKFSVLILLLVSEFVTGWTLALLFQVSHVTESVSFFKTCCTIPWSVLQVVTSADYSHGSWFWTHMSGGLNYQVVHHLFPGVNHCHYPAIAPIIIEETRNYGIPYQVYPTFWTALAAHFRHLRRLGNLSSFEKKNF